LGFNRLHAVLGGSDYCIATHPSDLAVALTALDAAVEVQGSDGVRTVPINEFYLVPGGTPERETVLRPGDLTTAILVPPPGMGERSHYLKLRDRASFEFALVSAAVAIALDDGRIRVARIAVGGVGTKPWRLPNVEAALAGAAVTPTVLTEAAAHAAEGARPFRDNAFKIALMQRAVARALATVTASGGERCPPTTRRACRRLGPARARRPARSSPSRSCRTSSSITTASISRSRSPTRSSGRNRPQRSCACNTAKPRRRSGCRMRSAPPIPRRISAMARGPPTAAAVIPKRHSPRRRSRSTRPTRRRSSTTTRWSRIRQSRCGRDTATTSA